MSIDAKEFDKHANPLKYIIEFLKNNSDKAFTVKAISEEVRIHVSEVKSAILWDSIASLLDRTYRSPIRIATVGGISYYKYESG